MDPAHRIAFVIPTKDRREDLGKLLASFSAQTRRPDLVIVVDGGDDVIKDVCDANPEVPIEYLRCVPPGFTKQKNAGTRAVPEGIDLVGYLDDDIVLEPDAVERMLAFWSTADERTGGAEFHITNGYFAPPTPFTRLFGTNNGDGGSILPSGINVVLYPVVETTQVEWLSGGATVWRKAVVDEVEHDEWFAGYGHMDDLDYSLSVAVHGWKMFVVADARLAHYERPIALEKEYPFGVYDTVNRYYLVKKYPDRFSVASWYWALLGKWLGRFVAGLRGDEAGKRRAKGYWDGLRKVVKGDLTLTQTTMK
jgi:GT2 family glycosyltransferase